MLAAHFNHSHHKELTYFIEDCTFEEDADLQALFLLATCFDDGHGLQEIRFEGCWHCSKPRLFEFGGHGAFLSREVNVIGTSSEHLIMGENLRGAILSNDAGSAADMIFASLSLHLLGIHDETIRAAIAAQVANRLQRMQSHP